MSTPAIVGLAAGGLVVVALAIGVIFGNPFSDSSGSSTVSPTSVESTESTTGAAETTAPEETTAPTSTSTDQQFSQDLG